MSGRAVLLAYFIVGIGLPVVADEGSVSMRTIEGQVLSIGQFEAESHLQVVKVELVTGGHDEPPAEILLAPETVCTQIGFEIRIGDQLRARVFLDDGPQRVQKIQNLTRGTMVRMRTNPGRHRHRSGRREGPS